MSLCLVMVAAGALYVRLGRFRMMMRAHVGSTVVVVLDGLGRSRCCCMAGSKHRNRGQHKEDRGEDRNDPSPVLDRPARAQCHENHYCAECPGPATLSRGLSL